MPPTSGTRGWTARKAEHLFVARKRNEGPAGPSFHAGHRGAHLARSRDVPCRSAGRRESGDGARDPRRSADRRVRSCRSSYRRSGVRGGACRSAGRRESGGGARDPRRSPDRRGRSCRSSYRRSGVRGGACRSAAGAKAAVEPGTRVNHRTAGFAAAAAPTGGPGCAVVHVGAPAGANAAVPLRNAPTSCADLLNPGFCAAARCLGCGWCGPRPGSGRRW